MSLPPAKWPDQPGSIAPARDHTLRAFTPTEIEAAVEQFLAYGMARGFSRRPLFLEFLAIGWMVVCGAAALLALTIIVATTPAFLVPSDNEIVQRPNWAAAMPSLVFGAALSIAGAYLLPCRLSIWFREAMAWRIFGKGNIPANVCGLWRSLGSKEFDAKRALSDDGGINALLWSIPIGLALIGSGLWLVTLAERDIHKISKDGFTTTAFWSSRVTYQKCSTLKHVTYDCSGRSTGKNSSSSFAVITYKFENGHKTEYRSRPTDLQEIEIVAAVDQQLRAAQTQVRFDRNYSRECILELTDGRDADFVATFDRLMHFAEWRKARGEE